MSERKIEPIVHYRHGRVLAVCSEKCPYFLDKPHIIMGVLSMGGTGYCREQPLETRSVCSHSYQPVITERTRCIPWYEDIIAGIYKLIEIPVRDTFTCESIQEAADAWPAIPAKTDMFDYENKCPKCGAGTAVDRDGDGKRFCINIGGWEEGDGCDWREE